MNSPFRIIAPLNNFRTAIPYAFESVFNRIRPDFECKAFHSVLDELSILKVETCFRLDSRSYKYNGIPDEALLDEGASGDRYRRELVPQRTILEFGSGGSTVEAVRKGCHVISVESDESFLLAVNDKIHNEFPSAHVLRLKAKTDASGKVVHSPALEQLSARTPDQQTVVLIHADIGQTTVLGYPKNRQRTESNTRTWSCYPQAPWSVINALSLNPDAILIDGRFRVACAALSLAYTLNHPKTSILFDDYADRQKGRWKYGKIELLARRSLHERMGELKILPGVRLQACKQTAALMSADFH